MNALGSPTPVWFRIAGIVAVLWELIGVWSYLGHVRAVPPMQPMTPAQEALAATVPGWVTGAFAVAVFVGLLASFAMLFGRAQARLLFLLSLVCILVQSVWVLFVSNARAVEGNVALVMPLVITGIGLLFYWLSSTGVKRGWLR